MPFRRKPEGLCSRTRANTKGSRKHTIGTYVRTYAYVYVLWYTCTMVLYMWTVLGHGASNHSGQTNQFDKMVIIYYTSSYTILNKPLPNVKASVVFEGWGCQMPRRTSLRTCVFCVVRTT